MKVLPFKIPITGNQSLIFQVDEEVTFYDKLHQHEELQITLIIRGEGKILVGDSIQPYGPGDVFLLGTNVPHVFISDKTDDVVSLMNTIFFTPDLLKKELGKIYELNDLIRILEPAEQGMRFVANRTDLAELIRSFGEAEQVERVIIFLQLLRLMVNSEWSMLSTFTYRKSYSELEGKRMSSIMNFTIENFASAISLEDVAEKANMNKNAFCRYFRQRTNKTYFQFLIEVRIENACKELVRNQDASIMEISERCGFQNISNFNRKFRELKQISPFNFRKQQLKQLQQLSH